MAAGEERREIWCANNSSFRIRTQHSASRSASSLQNHTTVSSLLSIRLSIKRYLLSLPTHKFTVPSNTVHPRFSLLPLLFLLVFWETSQETARPNLHGTRDFRRDRRGTPGSQSRFLRLASARISYPQSLTDTEAVARLTHQASAKPGQSGHRCVAWQSFCWLWARGNDLREIKMEIW
jgi:hypothetical protein